MRCNSISGQDKDATSVFPSLHWQFEIDTVFAFLETVTLDVFDSKSNLLLHECMFGPFGLKTNLQINFFPRQDCLPTRETVGELTLRDAGLNMTVKYVK
jgi:hypothetical protein